MYQSTDIEIRKAFHKKKLGNHHRCPDSLVIDELGLAHGKNRIDIAVLNSHLHGYEIKSAKDNLNRLPNQLEVYRASLEKLTLVSAPNHIDEVMSIVPDWCGIIIAKKGPRGGISFDSLRRPQKNPEIDAVVLAHLLWRKEALHILKELGVETSLQRSSRINLYKKIAEFISVSELTVWIKKHFMERENWRADQQLLLNDDLPQPVSM